MLMPHTSFHWDFHNGLTDWHDLCFVRYFLGTVQKCIEAEVLPSILNDGSASVAELCLEDLLVLQDQQEDTSWTALTACSSYALSNKEG
jgi:hypothetical protein